jgi:hypothetical protein
LNETPTKSLIVSLLTVAASSKEEFVSLTSVS